MPILGVQKDAAIFLACRKKLAATGISRLRVACLGLAGQRFFCICIGQKWAKSCVFHKEKQRAYAPCSSVYV